MRIQINLARASASRGDKTGGGNAFARLWPDKSDHRPAHVGRPLSRAALPLHMALLAAFGSLLAFAPAPAPDGAGAGGGTFALFFFLAAGTLALTNPGRSGGGLGAPRPLFGDLPVSGGPQVDSYDARQTGRYLHRSMEYLYFNVIGLLREHWHLDNREIEGYVLGELQGRARRCVEMHLAACSSCREEVNIIKSAISDFESPDDLDGNGASVASADEPQGFAWPPSSVMWINNNAYALKAVGGDASRVLIKGLGVRELEEFLRADQMEQGTYLVSITIGDAVLSTFALSKLIYRRAAPTALAAAAHGRSQTAGARPPEDGKPQTPLLKLGSEQFLLKLEASLDENVYLSAHPPAC